MKSKFKEISDQLHEELAISPDLRVQQLIDMDEALEDTMITFAKGLSHEQKQQWAEIETRVNELRSYAKLAKMRLLCGDVDLAEALRHLHDEHEEMEEKLREAEIQVERDAHQSTGIAGVFKALLMWKDSPEEKIARKDE